MTSESFLLTLSQIGVAVAGFGGLIVSLPRDTPQSSRLWRLSEISGIKLLLEYSFALVLLSLFPVVIQKFIATEERVWVLSAWVAACFILLEIGVQGYRLVVAYRRADPPRSPSLLIIMLAPAALLLASKFFMHVDKEGWYCAVLLWIVWGTGFQFWSFIREHIT